MELEVIVAFKAPSDSNHATGLWAIAHMSCDGSAPWSFHALGSVEIQARMSRKWRFSTTEAECTFGYMSIGSAEKRHLQAILAEYQQTLGHCCSVSTGCNGSSRTALGQTKTYPLQPPPTQKPCAAMPSQGSLSILNRRTGNLLPVFSSRMLRGYQPTIRLAVS